MPDYEQWERGDPFGVAARREAIAQRKERECGNCIHKRIHSGKHGEVEFRCTFSKRQFGTRCELFKSGEA